MWQFVADQIDQLDLALDQLAMRDRNFDRFAMMLIDNVVELTLHQQARECSYENKSWGRDDDPKYDPKAVAQALGQAFDAKVRLARISEMLSDAVADSLLYLHGYRNAVYHQGVRHEGILHGLAIFYFEIACGVLKAFNPMWWTSGNEKLSHRAVKYLGKPGLADGRDAFPAACDRLLLAGPANSSGGNPIRAGVAVGLHGEGQEVGAAEWQQGDHRRGLCRLAFEELPLAGEDRPHCGMAQAPGIVTGREGQTYRLEEIRGFHAADRAIPVRHGRGRGKPESAHRSTDRRSARAARHGRRVGSPQP